jgi:hypothetical protein
MPTGTANIPVVTAQPSVPRLPNWTLEETLLAWELYLQDYADPIRYPDATHPAVQRLSRHLRELPLHPIEARRSPRFRNPSGVARKIQNLMYFDTDGAQGSENGSAVDAQVAAGTRQLEAVRRLSADVRRGRRLSPPDLGKRAPQNGVVTREAYAEALQNLDGELDSAIMRSQRVEQRYLRQYLFGSHPLATCALCGQELPVNLLVAAHIKKRSSCSRAEKLDVANIVMAACKLGCDDLFERGYIAVNGRGIVIATSLQVAPALATALEGLEGRACSAFTEASAPYFAAHANEVFLDRRPAAV